MLTSRKRHCIYQQSFFQAPEKIDKCINEGRQRDEQPRYFSTKAQSAQCAPGIFNQN